MSDDRGQIRIVHTPDTSIYIYTHTGGTWMPGDVAVGLRDGKNHMGKWNDPEYLTRYIYEGCLSANGIGFEEHPDLDHPVITVRPGTRDGEEGLVSWEARDGSGDCIMSFTRYLQINPLIWADLHKFEDHMHAALLREAGQ